LAERDPKRIRAQQGQVGHARDRLANAAADTEALLPWNRSRPSLPTVIALAAFVIDPLPPMTPGARSHVVRS
jgi:hypothetical protein